MGKKTSDIKRKKMLEEVFKKAKKRREIAKKFDQKQVKKKPPKEAFKKNSKKNETQELVHQLDKKFDMIRSKKTKSGRVI